MTFNDGVTEANKVLAVVDMKPISVSISILEEYYENATPHDLCRGEFFLKELPNKAIKHRRKLQVCTKISRLFVSNVKSF